MTRKAVVLEVREDDALVSLTGAEECEGCAAKSSCFTLSGGGKREDTVWLANDAGASKGDLVEIELAPSASLKVISVTFLVPVLLLAAGYLLVYNGTDGQRALGAGIGLAVGILFALLANRRLSARGFSGLTMTRIVSREGCDPSA